MISNIKPDRAFSYILTILALFVPGLIYLYVTNHAVLLSLNYQIILLYSLLFSTPIYIISICGVFGAMFVLRDYLTGGNKEEQFLILLFGIGFMALFSTILAFLSRQLTDWHFYISYFLVPFAMLLILLLLAASKKIIDCRAIGD